MKLSYFAHSCFALRFGDVTLVTDPYDASVTYPPCEIECTAALVSHDHFDHNHTQTLKGSFKTVKAAGEYDIGGVHISAMESFHDDKQGALRGKNLLMKIEGEGLKFAHLGDLGHELNDAQKAFLADLDVLLIPIGGKYTIDTKQAEAIIAELKPRAALAMHYTTPEYDIGLATCDAFVRDNGAVKLPNEIEITKENIDELPKYFIMEYKR